MTLILLTSSVNTTNISGSGHVCNTLQLLTLLYCQYTVTNKTDTLDL